MSSPRLLKKTFDKGVVYLFQFERPTTLPNISPYCLKMETWLRANGVKYESVDSKGRTSSKNMTPFIEYNGKQLGDSNLIMDALPARLGIDHMNSHLTDDQRALSSAVHALVEDRMFWWNIAFYAREDFASGVKENGFNISRLEQFPYSLLKPLIFRRMQKYFYHRAFVHGVGRFTNEEILSFYKSDLLALSRLLGVKQFLLGDEKPSQVDITAFAHLMVAFYRRQVLPAAQQMTDFVQADCKNVDDYLRRLTKRFYPDWNQLCPNALFKV